MKLTGKEMNESIRQVGFIVLLAGTLALMIFELKYFIGSALGAFTLYMLLRKPHAWLLARKWPKMLATLTLLIGTVLLLFGVGGGIVSVLLPKLKGFHPQIVIDNVNAIHDTILQKTGYNIFSKDVVDKALQSLTTVLPGLFTTTGSILVNGFMSFVITFFMLQAGAKMERGVTEYMPLSPESISLVRHETNNIVVSNAIGIPIIVIGHGIISGLGYWMLGAGDPIVWGLITGLFGLIPVIGTAGIWIPLSINLFIEGEVWRGIILILYGALIVANTDNVLRMAMLKKFADVHPLVTLFGIILGLNLFGFWGIIFGPLMISGFLLLIKIYHNEFLTDAPKSGPKKKC